MSKKISGALFKVFVSLLSILPIVVIFILINSFGSDLPYADDWEYLGMVDKFYSGTLLFTDLFELHNVHNVFFPKIILLMLVSTVGWNGFYFSLVSVFFALITFGVICKLGLLNIYKQNKNNLFLFSIPLTSFLIFTPAAGQSWIWHTEYQIFMSITFTVWGLFLVCSEELNLNKYIQALMCGIVAMFSFGSGVLYWPISFIGLLFQNIKDKAIKTKYCAIWIFLSLLIIGIAYFGGGENKGLASIAGTVLNHDFLMFVSSFLGSMFIIKLLEPSSVITIIGLFVTAAFIAYSLLYRKSQVNKYLPFILMNMFACASAFFVGIVRFSSGTLPFMDHYVIISCLFWVSTTVFLMVFLVDLQDYLRRLNKPIVMLNTIVYSIFVLYLFPMINLYVSKSNLLFNALSKRKFKLQVAQKVIMDYPETCDLLFLTAFREMCPYPPFMCPAKEIKDSAMILKKYNLSIYRKNK